MNPAEYRTVTTGVSPFWAQKHAKNAHKNWDAFYKRNGTNFFRDRHWPIDQASDGFQSLSFPLSSSSTTTLFEAGCGVGNSIWPLLSENDDNQTEQQNNMQIFAFDMSPTAINLIKSDPRYPQLSHQNKLHVFVWDVCVTETPPDYVASADFVTLIFTLSAIPPTHHVTVAKRIAMLLKPGAKLLFRDYAAGDLAETRFKTRNKITDHYFVRQDGTLSYFFDAAEIQNLFQHHANLAIKYVRQVHRCIENRKESITMNRVFLQAEFEKPL